jgi:hypothetical protein
MRQLLALIALLAGAAGTQASVTRVEVTPATQAAAGVTVQIEATPGHKCSIIKVTIPPKQDRLKYHWQTLAQVQKGDTTLLSVPLEMRSCRSGARTGTFSISADLVPYASILLRCRDEKAGALRETFFDVKLEAYLAKRPRAGRPAPAKAEGRRGLKVFAQAPFHDRHYHIGPLAFDRPAKALVLRSAEELAAATRKAKAAKGGDLHKNAAFQKATRDEVAKLLGVKSIDWGRQMVVAFNWGRFRFKKEVEFLSFDVEGKTLTVRWRLNELGAAGYISAPRGIALVERFEGDVRFDPPPLE